MKLADLWIVCIVFYKEKQQKKKLNWRKILCVITFAETFICILNVDFFLKFSVSLVELHVDSNCNGYSWLKKRSKIPYKMKMMSKQKQKKKIKIKRNKIENNKNGVKLLKINKSK